MSITDELREYASNNDIMHYHHEYIAIADRIDAEHERVRAESIIDMTDESMAEHGWVRGPLDADGKMWRSGDMSDSNWGVIEGIAYEDGRWLVSGHDTSAPWVPADSISHYHAPTVEDVLREFAGTLASADNNWGSDVNDAIAKYAAKLSLAEGEDA